MKQYYRFLFFLMFAISLNTSVLGDEWIFEEEEDSSDSSCTRSSYNLPEECLYTPLMRDLMIVDYWNKCMNDPFPVYYNHLLEGGYFNMPSAMMGAEGEIGFGYSYVPPYRNWNLRFQLASFLELTGSYRIFTGVDDPILTPLGFGDMSDKGANIKIALLRPEMNDYKTPGLAIGWQDFMGTKNFTSKYIVLTQVFKPLNMELSVGYGTQRIRRWFGGITWVPFRNHHWLLKDLSFSAEYDATPYKDPEREPHPKGREQKNKINWGARYRLLDHFDFSISYVRGMKLAMAASVFYNFGYTEGFLPKVEDCLPYRSPLNTEPIGYARPANVMSAEFAEAFNCQGFDLYEIRTGWNCKYGRSMYFRIENNKWRLESTVRERLNYLLAYLVPENIDTVFVAVETFGVPVQEYHFPMKYLRKWRECEICSYELKILSPLRNYTTYNPCDNTLLYRRPRELWNLELLPKTHTFFGSSKGKFKYALGLRLNANGFLCDQLYYDVSFGWIALSNLDELSGQDRLNPSQIINVRTDIVRYYRKRGITIDKAYLQKNWNLGRGWFGKLSGGYFEQEYGGGAAEVLYFPLDRWFAFGLEGALIKKRTVGGLGFTNKIRKYNGFIREHRHFTGSQYFANLYYNWKPARLELKVKGGKFLANDWGARFEVSRYFPSGLQLSFWYTYTSAKDYINGERYHDKGLALSMPLDIFYTHTERSRWGYGMNAWLRDVGQIAETGKDLYEIISELRQTPCGQIK